MVKRKNRHLYQFKEHSSIFCTISKPSEMNLYTQENLRIITSIRTEYLSILAIEDDKGQCVPVFFYFYFTISLSENAVLYGSEYGISFESSVFSLSYLQPLDFPKILGRTFCWWKHCCFSVDLPVVSSRVPARGILKIFQFANLGIQWTLLKKLNDECQMEKEI